MVDFTIERSVQAPIDTVFAKLTDHRAYASMTWLRHSTLEREGSPAPNGVGAIRACSVVGPPLREEITAYEPPHHFAYKFVSGPLPVHDYAGDVRLEGAGGATRMIYHVTATAPALVRPMLGAVMKPAISGLAKGIARAAEGEA